MKVLQINSVCGVGSTGRIVTDIHNILTTQGHKSFVAYGRKPFKQIDNTIRIGTNLDFFFHVAQTRIFDHHGFGSKQATISLVKNITELNPDIIHLHNLHGYYLNVEVLFDFLKLNKTPVVWTLHDCWAFTGHCAHFDYAKCEKWKTECRNCSEKKSYPKSILIDSSKENFKRKMKAFSGIDSLTVVTPSKWLRDLVEESYLSNYPIQVINNGIDLSLFKSGDSDFRDKYGIKKKFVILGLTNQWSRRKGLNFFIDLSCNLRKDEVIVLIGLSKQQLKKIPNSIIGLSTISSVQELSEIYSSADVYVNPTLEDNFPTTNLEALACGTPVVTFNTGGSVESIDEGTGLIATKLSLKDLILKINMIKTHGKDFYKRACLLRANEYYNKDMKYNEYISLYKSLI